MALTIFFIIFIYFISIGFFCILSADMFTEIINMDSGSPMGTGSGGGSPMDTGGGAGSPTPGSPTPTPGSPTPTPTPNPGSGPGWQPFHYSPDVRDDGQSYPSDNPSPGLVTNTYSPIGLVPVRNDKELGVLIDYRFNDSVRPLGYKYWNIANIFPTECLIDKIARERLLAHIYEHRTEIPAAYAQLDMLSGTPRWNNVKVTSFLINSLNNSNN